MTAAKITPISAPVSAPATAKRRPSNKEIGGFGEQVAARFLMEKGIAILHRNWRCSDGEIDIIARDGSTLIFCEVKTRSSNAFGPPGAAVGQVKASRIRRLAVRWLNQTQLRAEQVRFDVVSVWLRPPAAVRVEHAQGAF